jgi:hypothetical protein
MAMASASNPGAWHPRPLDGPRVPGGSAAALRRVAIPGPIPARIRLFPKRGAPAMSFKIFFIRLHKWAALVVGIQMLLWVAGGLAMSLFELDEVHGDLTKAVIEPKPLRWDRLVALSGLYLIGVTPWRYEARWLVKRK